MVKTVTEENVRDGIVKEYIRFCKIFDGFRKGAKTRREIEDAIQETLKVCMEKDILRDFLIIHGKEKENMITLFTEEQIAEMVKWDEEEMKREAYVEGEEVGRREGREETAKNMKKEGIEIKLIMKVTGLSEERVRKL